MNNDPLSFLDSSDTSASNNQQAMGSDPLSFLESPKQRKSQFPATFKEFTSSRAPEGRGLLPDAITTGTALAGGLGDLASLFVGEHPLTSKRLREKAFEFVPSAAPKNDQEKEYDENLSMVMGLFSPIGGPLKAAGKVLGKVGGKLTPFLKGKYKEIYDVGKSLGIAEEALAPFKHGKVTQYALEKAAKLGKTAQEGIKFAENLASPKYQELFEAGSKIPLNPISKRGVINGLENVVTEIEKSPALVSESKDVVKFLNEAINGIKIKPDMNVENLMALQKQMGKTVNWKSIKQSGKGRLIKEAQDAVKKGIYGSSPKLGRDFDNMDKLYGAYKKFAKDVSPSKILDYANKGGPVGYALISLMTGHDLETAVKGGFGAYFGKQALGKISGKLLTDPKWIGIKEKIMRIIKDGAYDKAPKMLIALQKKAEADKEIRESN